MSQTITTELQERMETTTTHLDAITAPADEAPAVEADITRQEIEQRLDELVAHHGPVDEAVRTVVRGARARGRLRTVGPPNRPGK